MKTRNSVMLMAFFPWIMFFSSSTSAAIDPASDKVSLRTSCTVNGNALDNCFTSWGSLNSWIKTTRLPNASTPLEVDIGPGTFGPDLTINDHLVIKCQSAAGYTGYISYIGAGSNQTILIGAGGGNYSPLVVQSCTNLSFSHLQISNPHPSLSGYGAVQWSGGGVSHWDNVQLIGKGRAWYEGPCGATPGAHYWTSSQLIGTAAFTVADTYDASCDESFFFGSQITINASGSDSGNGNGAVVADGMGIIHLYGSQLRAIISGLSSQTNAVPAANAYNGGMIHIHGTGIDASSQSGSNITALSASSGGMIHANSSAFMMSSTGTMTRISNNGGMIMAPYLWQEDATPPSIVSANGSDQVVITSTSDGHPHTLVYDNTCAKKWYDTTTRTCY